MPGSKCVEGIVDEAISNFQHTLDQVSCSFECSDVKERPPFAASKLVRAHVTTGVTPTDLRAFPDWSHGTMV